MKQRIKAGLDRLGFQVGRVPPLAADGAYAIAPDFEYVLAHYLRRRTLAPAVLLRAGRSLRWCEQ